jgi:phage regulator Rha-like protein
VRVGVIASLIDTQKNGRVASVIGSTRSPALSAPFIFMIARAACGMIVASCIRQEVCVAKTDDKGAEIVSLEPVPTDDIKGLILTVRGKQVLLDSDVARLYGYETRRINETAKRNAARFPERYRFQLTLEEAERILSISQSATLNDDTMMRSQSATASKRNERYLHFCYTEQGVSMLAGLLRSDIAVQVSIRIIDAFVEMRQFINANRDVFAKILSIDNRLAEHDNKLIQQDTKIDEILNLLSAPETIKQSIFFGGQFYDALTLIIEIIQKAKTRITIIDNYVDNSVLEMLANKNDKVAVTIITANPNKLSHLNLEKFVHQYGEIAIVESKSFHDRFIIIDGKEVYAFGASLKDAGNKCFAVSKNEDTARFLDFVDEVVDKG